MEKLRKWSEKQSTNTWSWIKSIVVALWLMLWASNFSYSQESWWRYFNKTEQTGQLWEKGIEAYRSAVVIRDYNIDNETSETINEFVTRMNNKLLYGANNSNSLISKNLTSIKSILQSKYELQLGNDPVLIIESALKELAKAEKYKWLKEYTDNFSWKFDLNFINAYWFVRFQNNWNRDRDRWLSGKDWAYILQSIYNDLNNIENISSNVTVINSRQSHDNNVQVTPRNSENVENNGMPNTEIDARNMNWITLLSNNLSSDKLNWVTYEDVWNTVNSFKHEWLRNAVMDRLLHNDIIWAQRLLWMELNCDPRLYPDYVAGRKLWQRELRLMEKHWEFRRYMDSQEFLNNMEKVERAYWIENYEVKTAYLKFVSWEFDNEWLPYCIISKYDYKIYLFSADHKFLAAYPVVTWAHEWNHPNDVWEHLRDPRNAHHTTPWWMYKFWWFFDRSLTWKDLTAGFGTHFWVFVPMEWQYNYSDECALWIHGFVMWREWMFYSQDMKNRLASNWCINFLRKLFWDLFNHLKKGSKIYICRDDELSSNGLTGYNDNGIEMIEHFWCRPQKVMHWNEAENYGYCKNSTWTNSVLGRRILSHNESIWSELPYRYNLNIVTSSSKANMSRIFAQHKNPSHQRKYIS